MRSYTFHGRLHRVQLKIIDLTDAPRNPEPRPNFLVMALPASRHPATAFARGQRFYWGDDPDVAWDQIHCLVPDLLSQCPRSLRTYLFRWSKRPT